MILLLKLNQSREIKEQEQKMEKRERDFFLSFFLCFGFFLLGFQEGMVREKESEGKREEEDRSAFNVNFVGLVRRTSIYSP